MPTPGALYQPGMWRLPPAGSTHADALPDEDLVDLQRQFATGRAEASWQLF